MKVSGLGGKWTNTSHHYMVPVVNVDDKIQTVKAMGVARIAPLSATKFLADIEERFLQTKGRGTRLARPAKEFDLLIGMDN
jgi:hypothetical protein